MHLTDDGCEVGPDVRTGGCARISWAGPAPSSSRAASTISQHRRAWVRGSDPRSRRATPAPCRSRPPDRRCRPPLNPINCPVGQARSAVPWVIAQQSDDAVGGGAGSGRSPIGEAEVVALGVARPGVRLERLDDGGPEPDEPLDLGATTRRHEVEVQRLLHHRLEVDLLRSRTSSAVRRRSRPDRSAASALRRPGRPGRRRCTAGW